MRTQPAQSNNEGNALGTQDDAGRRQEPRQKHGIFKTIIITTAILAIGIGLVAWWLNSRKFEGTDDAYVIGAIVYAIDRKPMQLDLLREGDWIGISAMAIGLGSLIAMLEEGQRKDWFGSEFIQHCGILAAIFIPGFVIIELARKKPFVNLRLVGTRNLGISSAVNFFLGLALYGSVYLLPQYLTIVQGYSAFQIGLSMIWVGIPQLVIFPFVPQLMKRFDLRLLVCFGTLVFATSSWMNTSMSHDYAGQQFAFANIVRAIGQPCTIIPLSSLATTLLDPKYAGDGSALFNIARNLGGSVGTALLSTVIVQREQFHDFRIGENVNTFRLAVQSRVEQITSAIMAKGYDPVTATKGAYAQMKNVVRREAYVMAFNDAFLVVMIGLLISAVLVWFCQKTTTKDGMAQ